MSASYKAFISYSHHDLAEASWLQRAIERYRLPRRLGANRQRLYPVFRDQSELATSDDLSEALQDALRRSEALVVVCSPAAAQSHWTNAEVSYFQQNCPDRPVLCLLIEGSTREAAPDCALPPALLRDGTGAALPEPLAADVRSDGKRLALLKIVAGLLGIGIADLRQRDAQRRTRNAVMLAAGSLVMSAVLAVLTVMAFRAQDEAELHRLQAEDLITFMLGDLRSRLEPIGRLDLLDAVGDKAMEHFASLSANDLPQNVLGQARALRQIGEVRMAQGRMQPALEAFDESRSSLQHLHDAHPHNNNYLFELGQSEFWIGFVQYSRGALDDARGPFEAYADVSRRLLDREPDNPDYLLELIYAYSNAGSLLRALGEYELARDQFAESVRLNGALLARTPDDPELRFELAEGYSWIGSIEADLAALEPAEAAFAESLRLYAELAASFDNARYVVRQANAAVLLAGNLLQQGETERAAALLREGVTLFAGLTEQDPGNATWQRGFARSRVMLAEINLLEDRADRASVLAELEASVDAFAELVATDASRLDWVLGLARSQTVLAGALHESDPARALELSREAYQRLRGDERVVGGRREGAAALVRAYDMHAVLLEASGEVAAARVVWQEALDLVEDLDERNPVYVAYLTRLLQRVGRDAEAGALIDALQAAGFRHPGFQDLLL